jgi:hypothetical protein
MRASLTAAINGQWWVKDRLGQRETIMLRMLSCLVALQDNQKVEHSKIASLEALCASSIQQSIKTGNICRTLATIFALQPAVCDLFDHLLQYLCKNLREVLSDEVCGPTRLTLIITLVLMG